MNKLKIIFIIIIFSTAQLSFAQKAKSDSNIFGHVICLDCDDHISFATISVKGTTIGTTTDETGHFQLINLPAGTHIIQASHVGYKPTKKLVTIEKGQTKEINFELEKDMLGLEEVVVTADRNETNRRTSSVIVNTIDPKLLTNTQSVTIGEGLNFTPGLRLENNCQNCGFTQVRMNGLEGPYSQILINSRPIFSGLAGVYGLELIPSSMIDKIEVVRGGGSALYGSNAIAGTINLILKEPVNNSYEFGINTGLIGSGLEKSDNPAQDYAIDFNTALVSADNKTGMSLFGFHRNREHFDANNDDFSEISSINNTTIGTRLYHRFGTRSKVAADFFTINEERRGGDKFEYPKHETNIAESVEHNITTGALCFEHFFRDVDLLSIYASGQAIKRDSYYGAEQSLSDYGKTNDFSFTFGAQYNARFENSNMTLGIENTGGVLKDKKLGYPDIEHAQIVNDTIANIPHTNNVTIAHQTTNTIGVFTQYEVNFDKLKISAGARFDSYNIENKRNENSHKSGSVFSPRLTIKYDILNYFQARISYSQGYRAPQIFDEDLHIETSGSRKVIHKNNPALKQETSHSFMASLDFNKQLGKNYLGLLLEGFYTQLNDPFANKIGEPDQNGKVIYERINAEHGAKVKGINIEMKLIPSKKINFTSGFTLQTSKYEKAQEFNEKKFFRTPDNYGYFSFNWKLIKQLEISTNANYTGKMLVPYFGMQIPNPDEGVLRESDPFFDAGIKIAYGIKLNGATLQLFTGSKNIFNSYQDDFDTGINRDPGYIYGPLQPRTLYFGIKVGNFLK